MRIFLTVIVFLFITVSSFSAIDTATLIAYPVPFNPVRGTKTYLTIDDKSGTWRASVNKIKVHIYDVNGDNVLDETYSGLPVTWNGRNGQGTMVKPGLYIIKVSVENTGNSDYASKIIRIVVTY